MAANPIEIPRKARRKGDPIPERSAYTVDEARGLLGEIARPTIYELFRSGKLRSFRIGRRRMIAADAIRDYIVSAERETASA